MRRRFEYNKQWNIICTPTLHFVTIKKSVDLCTICTHSRGQYICQKRQQTYHCIVNVWMELDPAIIQNGFIKCCIANTMDGSQDNAVWTDSDTDGLDGDKSDDDDVFYMDIDVDQESRIMQTWKNSTVSCIRRTNRDTEFEGFETDDRKLTVCTIVRSLSVLCKCCTAGPKHLLKRMQWTVNLNH